jgi:hypothetical protein
MSEGWDFTPGGILHELVGPDGCSSTADTILEGTFDIDILWDVNRSDAETLLTFITHMVRPKDHEGKTVPDMKWQYGAAEYRASLSKKSEDTSCGPSELHMAHWIAACEDDELSQLHADFIGTAFSIGQLYERWQTSYHAMIQKKTEPGLIQCRLCSCLKVITMLGYSI